MEDAIKKLKKLNAKRVLIQVPEGLKTKVVDISRELEDAGFETIVSCEENFGACDILDDEALRFGCDTILHVGHTDFGLKTQIPVVYHEYYYDLDPVPTLKKSITKLSPYKKIGLFSSLQFLKVMGKAKEYLEKNGKEVILGNEGMECEGQVLGCRLQNPLSTERDADCFLYVGAGLFHPLGVALSTEKPVFTLDMEKKGIFDLKNEKMKYLKKKAWFESELKDAKTVGLLISWKRGQNRIAEALKMKARLEKEGKDVTILAFDKIEKGKIEGMKFDILVTVACPRMDDEYIFN
jgi:2-(3-amino-3-carboxypropyl)histidine synthase